MEDWSSTAAAGETVGDDASWDERPPVRVSAMPILHLDGFDGPMDLLLDLVERQRIDLGQMSILALVEQFLVAFDQMRDRVPIERRADWLVMATRLVLLRSRLLFPESPEAAKAAEQEAASALRRLDELVAMRAAAAWLGAQPILGERVFPRGMPERTGLQLGTEHEVDVIAFLWASLALFEDDAPPPDTVTRYRPSWTDLYSVGEARDRILRILGEGGDGATLDRFLPEMPAMTDENGTPFHDALSRSSAWATTFSASLELAKQGDVALAQAEAFWSVHVSRPTVQLPD
ncbi:MAG TPA: segregation/condensation protein A [Opitutaceae bacterium]|nr:segregation/condensation protein A [Opitutaceae bacterium]